jgi:thiol-disulfide isomerase/thioredoxin
VFQEETVLGRACVSFCLVLGCDSAAAPAREATPERAPPAEVRAAAPPADELDASFVSVDASSIASVLRDRSEPVLLVNVWSTWCEPCMEEFPGLVAIGREYESRGLGTVFISMDAPSQREAAREFVTNQHAPVPSYVRTGSDGDFIEALHPEWSGVLPATMLFDRERRARYLFEEPVDRTSLREPLETLLAPDGDEG